MADTFQSLPEGTVLGDYVILRTLGQGGFGVTYLAKDTAVEPLAEDWLESLEKEKKKKEKAVPSRGAWWGKKLWQLAVVALLMLAGAEWGLAACCQEKGSTFRQERSGLESEAGQLRLQAREAVIGRPVGEPMKHDDIVTSVTWSPDGTKIASGGGDGTIRVWNAATGRPEGIPMKHDDYVLSVSWSSDSTKIASGEGDGTGGTVRVWRVR